MINLNNFTTRENILIEDVIAYYNKIIQDSLKNIWETKNINYNDLTKDSINEYIKMINDTIWEESKLWYNINPLSDLKSEYEQIKEKI